MCREEGQEGGTEGGDGHMGVRAPVCVRPQREKVHTVQEAAIAAAVQQQQRQQQSWLIVLRHQSDSSSPAEREWEREREGQKKVEFTSLA